MGNREVVLDRVNKLFKESCSREQINIKIIY